MSIVTKEQRRLKRRRRVRAKVRGTAARPRISVFRSNRGHRRAAHRRRARATRWPPSRGPRPTCAGSSPIEQAAQAGKALAERAKDAGIERAVFDRGGYQYHGRVKAFAEGVREGGLAV